MSNTECYKPAQGPNAANSEVISTILTMDPMDWRDVRHAVFIGFSAFWGGLGQGQGGTRAPPGLPPGLWSSQEVPACLAPASLAGLGVEMPLLHQPGVVERKAIAERAAVWELSVGAGRVVLRPWPVCGVQELRRGCVGQGTSSPLAVMIRFWSFRVKSRILKPRGWEMYILFKNSLQTLQAPLRSYWAYRFQNKTDFRTMLGTHDLILSAERRR